MLLLSSFLLILLFKVFDWLLVLFHQIHESDLKVEIAGQF